jgi:hypothetical protein
MRRCGHDAFGSLVPSPGLLDLFLEIPGDQRQSRALRANPAELFQMIRFPMRTRIRKTLDVEEVEEVGRG